MKELVINYPNGRMVLYVERFFPCTVRVGRKVFPLIRMYASDENIVELEKYLITFIRDGQLLSESLYADAEKHDNNKRLQRHLCAEAGKTEREWKRAQRNQQMLGGG